MKESTGHLIITSGEYMYNSCETGCVWEILKSKDVEISEENLICCDDIFGMSSKPGIFLYDMHKTICHSGQCYGFTIKECQGNIRELLLHDKVLLNIPCRVIEYSDVYRKMKLNDVNHFVYISSINGNQILLNDPYIPSRKQLSFCGWISGEILLNNINQAYVIDIDKKKSSEIQQFRNILQSALYVLEKSEIVLYERLEYINNMELLDEEHRKNLFWESAIRLKGSGLVASRILFKNLLQQLQFNELHLLEVAERVCQEYICLEYELLKCKYRICDFYIKDIIKRIQNIYLEENRLMKMVIKQIENRNGENYVFY